MTVCFKISWIIRSIVLVSCLVVLGSCENNHSNKTGQGQIIVQDSISIQDGVIIQDSLSSGIPIQKQKINKRNLIIKEWNTNVLTNTKILDHVTTYNPEGQKIEEIEYNNEGQKWRERYEYGPNGNKTRELLYDGRNVLISVKKYEYNEYGRKKITYTYNSKGKLIGVKNYEYITQ